jgi:hypothetical protein
MGRRPITTGGARIRLATTLVRMRTVAVLMHMQPKGWQCGEADANWETVYVDEGAGLWAGPQLN